MNSSWRLSGWYKSREKAPIRAPWIDYGQVQVQARRALDICIWFRIVVINWWISVENLKRKSQIDTAMPWPYICGSAGLSDFRTNMGPSSKNGGTFSPRNLSATQARQQSSMMAVADHVIARNSDPRAAVTPMLRPSALMRLVTLEAKLVARPEAISRNI